MKFSKTVNSKKCASKIIFFNEKKFQKDLDNFWHRKSTWKVRILPFLTTFTQLNTRLKNFVMGWLLVLGLKECLAECATLFVKSEVMLRRMVKSHKYLRRTATYLETSGYLFWQTFTIVMIDTKLKIEIGCNFSKWNL